MFFFAARHFLTNMDNKGSSALPLTRWIAEQGGGKIQSINIEVGDFSVPQDLRKKDVMKPLLHSLKQNLEVYRGQYFWAADIEKIKTAVLEEGWVKSVSIKRNFQGSLDIHVEPRIPHFIGRSMHGWVVFDQEGYVLSLSKQVSGTWATLPVIYGLEEVFSMGESPVEINRKLTSDRKVLKDLAELISELKSKVDIQVETVNVQKDAWTEDFLFDLTWLIKKPRGKQITRNLIIRSGHWKDRLENLQFVLSDLKTKKIDGATIRGQFADRWYVERGKK